ncbi:unnamed protein product [Vicia faba]|uniref:C2H2-type domain-containing protein n=1 Tax=Vicia faba TaxID=3906 RepID=A0AAV0Z8R9_VICFA|nr:unnamed protein product [Vicia faba]
MSVAKLKASDTTDVMRTEDGIETIIRQAIGKEPLFYFPRVSDSPGQLIPFLHAFDPQGVGNVFSEYPGWPLLYPLKVPTDKCEKCSQEFCSTLNYRRHLPVHHRFKKLDKDTSKTRELLGAYWDKLSVEEVKEVLSFENVMLEEVPGSSVLHALVTLTQKQGLFFLLPCYLRAGAALLDIVQSKPSSFPIPSQELFSILDDASEGTFLLGTTVSMQKSVFPEGAGKIGLEPKNVVACSSFLLEQILVKAWLADKDAEALRCQKQLVDEEEAAHKRQAKILERKRQKKLRQKEQKAKEQRNKVEVDTEGNIYSTMKTVSPAETSLDTYDVEAQNPEVDTEGNIDSTMKTVSPAETSLDTYDVEAQNPEVDTEGNIDSTMKTVSPAETSLDTYDFEAQNPEVDTEGNIDSTMKTVSPAETSLDTYDFEAQNPEESAKNAPPVPLQSPDINEGKNGNTLSEHDFGADLNIRQSQRELDDLARWPQLPKFSQRTASDQLTNKNPPISNPEVIQKYGTRDDQWADGTFNAGKAWHGKLKPEIDRMVLKTVTKTEPDLVKNHEFLIGSISVNLANCSQSEGNVVASQEKCLVENAVAIEEKNLIENTSDKQNSSQNKPKKPDLRTSENNQSIVEPSTAVIQFETEDPFPAQSGGMEDAAVNKNQVCRNRSRICSDESGFENKVSNTESRVDPVKQKFSIQTARDFLAKRWEEALSSDHVKLVISLDSELSGNQEAKEEDILLSTTKASKSKCRGKAKKETNDKEKTT